MRNNMEQEIKDEKVLTCLINFIHLVLILKNLFIIVEKHIKYKFIIQNTHNTTSIHLEMFLYNMPFFFTYCLYFTCN